MALKDWKKVESDKGKFGNDYIKYKNKKTGEIISLWGLTDGKINKNKRIVKSNIKIVWEVKGRKFGTSKSKAQQYLKSYMRTH